MKIKDIKGIVKKLPEEVSYSSIKDDVYKILNTDIDLEDIAEVDWLPIFTELWSYPSIRASFDKSMIENLAHSIAKAGILKWKEK